MCEVDRYLSSQSTILVYHLDLGSHLRSLVTNPVKHINNPQIPISRGDVQNHVTSLRASTVIRNPGQTVQQGTTSHQPTHAELLNLANPRHTHETEIHCLQFPLLFRKTSPYRTNETANMSHESVWYSRPRKYGKASIGWYVCD